LCKLASEKEHLLKQIQFLESMSCVEKTRSMQSYRERYLEAELEGLREELQKSRGEREDELESQIKELKEERFSMESHYKAMKVANECLIKQISSTQSSNHQVIINSEEYKKLRDKYIGFLKEFKVLRNEYWVLKAEANSRQVSSNDSDDLFSLTASEAENDYSLLFHSPSNPHPRSIPPRRSTLGGSRGKNL
jgi:hypothetical protein